MVDLHDVDLRARLFKAWPVKEVWGIGRAMAAKLKPLGIHNAADLAAMSPTVARDIGTVVLERLVRELNGIECDDFHPDPEPLQGTAVTRGFAEPISDLMLLQEAMARRAWRAAEKIRAQQLVASRLIVFAHGSRFKAGTPSASKSANLSPQTNDPRRIMSLAMRMTEALFQRGGRYNKCGVLLEGLVPAAMAQADLFSKPDPRADKLLSAVDGLNGRFGRGTVQIARQGFETRPTDTKREYKSPAWTTNIRDIPVAC